MLFRLRELTVGNQENTEIDEGAHVGGLTLQGGPVVHHGRGHIPESRFQVAQVEQWGGRCGVQLAGAQQLRACSFVVADEHQDCPEIGVWVRVVGIQGYRPSQIDLCAVHCPRHRIRMREVERTRAAVRRSVIGIRSPRLPVGIERHWECASKVNSGQCSLVRHLGQKHPVGVLVRSKYGGPAGEFERLFPVLEFVKPDRLHRTAFREDAADPHRRHRRRHEYGKRGSEPPKRCPRGDRLSGARDAGIRQSRQEAQVDPEEGLVRRQVKGEVHKRLGEQCGQRAQHARARRNTKRLAQKLPCLSATGGPCRQEDHHKKRDEHRQRGNAQLRTHLQVVVVGEFVHESAGGGDPLQAVLDQPLRCYAEAPGTHAGQGASGDCPESGPPAEDSDLHVRQLGPLDLSSELEGLGSRSHSNGEVRRGVSTDNAVVHEDYQYGHRHHD